MSGSVRFLVDEDFDAVKQRLEIIKELTNDGFPQEVAERLVDHHLQVIAQRDKDDPTLKSLLATVQKFLPDSKSDRE